MIREVEKYVEVEDDDVIARDGCKNDGDNDGEGNNEDDLDRSMWKWCLW